MIHTIKERTFRCRMTLTGQGNVVVLAGTPGARAVAPLEKRWTVLSFVHLQSTTTEGVTVPSLVENR